MNTAVVHKDQQEIDAYVDWAAVAINAMLAAAEGDVDCGGPDFAATVSAMFPERPDSLFSKRCPHCLWLFECNYDK